MAMLTLGNRPNEVGEILAADVSPEGRDKLESRRLAWR